MKAKQILAIFIAMLLVAVAVPFVASAAPETQAWYLNDTVVSGVGYEMDRGAPDSTESSVTVGAGSNVTWRADEAATVDVPFPSGNWDGFIKLTAAPGAGTIRVYVGELVGTTFTNYGTQLFTLEAGDDFLNMSFTGSPFTVDTGNYLAIYVENYFGSAIYVDTGGGLQSTFTSPSTDPGYPIPELPTIVLFATGLVGLAGYFGLKRRKRAYVRA